MTRRPGFWVVFAVLSAASVLVAVRLFPAAFPIITLDLVMDRETAVSEAEALALRNGWDPPGARAAATFGQTDSEVQTYVELEAGGRDAFVRLAEEGIYHPYVWTVRRFAEGAVEESRVWFTPAGEPYGFDLRLREDDPGSGNATEGEALAVARAEASEWGVDLGSFELLESSGETQPGGRLDHTFVFERTGAQVADGRFRLRIRVAGNRAAGLTHFVYVPEAFSQRFAEMRSANQAIALGSQSVFIILFLLVGGGVGTALLARRRWIVWRPPLAWGALTAVLLGLGMANTLPLSWMEYDTAVSVGTFLAGQLGVAAAAAVIGTPLLAFVYLAAESLDRRAFPDHLQQWRFWSPEVAASAPALGRTAGAYFLAGLQLGYVVLFYLATSRLDGWWSPAEAVVQPDLLATPQPWILAVSTSLFAAFWEESAFRAIPIACAALLGARFGQRRLWIVGAVVLQALVFAAGHANYPQQPAYARVVELSVPALVWGITYLRFGLVPTILAHFTYNLSLISLPLFASAAPGVLPDRVAVVAAALLPLAVVWRARRKVGARAQAPEWAYNRAWRAPPAKPEPSGEPEPSGASGPGPAGAPGRLPLRPGILWPAGAAGVLAWAAWALGPAAAGPRVALSRAEAVAEARGALAERGHAVESWRALALIDSDRGAAHRYVYGEAGDAAYNRLLGSYLAGPRWVVRFVDFAADPEERVEEFRVDLGPAGERLRLEHTVPEGRPGASLSEEDARTAALGALRERFGVEAGSVEEVGAAQTARPARTDWRFTFEEPGALAAVPGEAELTVALAGDEVADADRSVSVPEEWELARREGEALGAIAGVGAGLFLLLGFAAAAVAGVAAWAKGRLDTRLVLRAGVLAAGVIGLGQANAWPVTEAFFTPEQGWGLQAGVAVFGAVLVVLVGSAVLGLSAVLAHAWLGAGAGWSGEMPAPRSLVLPAGMALAGLGALGERLAGGLPPWPDALGAGAFLPPLAAPLTAALASLVATTGVLLMSCLALRSAGRPGLGVLLGVVALAAGILLAPSPLDGSLGLWGLGALLAAAVTVGLALLGRAAPALVPGIIATVVSAGLLVQVVTGPYPGARLGGVLGLGAVAALASVWTRMLGDAAPR